MRFYGKNTAFTIAETLIILIVLGIIAAVTIPVLIKNYVDNTNRTKVKKAMATYEKVLNSMIIENDLRSTDAIIAFGHETQNGGACGKTRQYFKIVQEGSTNCVFKTPDNIYWNIYNIENPIIILKEFQKDEYISKLQNKAKDIKNSSVFAMVGGIDDTGIIRINDNAYEQKLENNTANQKYVKKLWYFLTKSNSLLNELDICKANNQNTCPITINGTTITYIKITAKEDVTVGDNSLSLYNRSTESSINNYNSTSESGSYWIQDPYEAVMIREEEAKSEQTCAESIYPDCSTKGDYYEAAKLKCQSMGGRLPSLAELEIARKNGKMYGWTFSNEERTKNQIYALDSYGSISIYNKYYPLNRAQCISE